MKLPRKYIYSDMFCLHGFIVLFLCILLISLTSSQEETGNKLQKINNIQIAQRIKRAPDGEDDTDKSMDYGQSESQEDSDSSTPEDESAPEEEKKSAVSLSAILGICLLICTIIYCIGIGYKIFKIFKGTYVEEEPVFLKYK